MYDHRPFEAASNKLAYAQVFAGPTARRRPQPSEERSLANVQRRRTMLLRREKASSAAH